MFIKNQSKHVQYDKTFVKIHIHMVRMGRKLLKNKNDSILEEFHY